MEAVRQCLIQEMQSQHTTCLQIRVKDVAECEGREGREEKERLHRRTGDSDKVSDNINLNGEPHVSPGLLVASH